MDTRRSLSGLVSRLFWNAAVVWGQTEGLLGHKYWHVKILCLCCWSRTGIRAL